MLPATDERIPSPETLSQPAIRWLPPMLIGTVLVLATILIFTGLGHYAFWDDEAATALGAKGIMRTGSNNALIDYGNIVAYHDGFALHGFSNRIEPLLAPYLTAASFELFGIHTWSGRLPFALFGVGTFALMLLWARRVEARVLVVLAVGLLGNVSLVLFARNCRYYMLAVFFSLALAFIYRRGKADSGSVAAFIGLSILLFTSNYLNYIAFYVCLVLDYFVWQRKQSPLGWRTIFHIFVPQLVIVGVIAAIWNPLQTPHGDNIWQNSFWDKLTLFYWQWRDMNQCEFLCLPLMLLTIGLGLAQRRHMLMRGCVALIVYVAVITMVSPQLVGPTHLADVRYLAPVIPLAVALETATLCALLGGRAVFLVGAALIVFGTNLLNSVVFFHEGIRSTLVSYLGELTNPPPDPYTPTAAWINGHVLEGRSVWVQPNYATYSLMIHAPKALYAWQFAWPPRPSYVNLPPIHFMGEVPPDYLVAFGPSINDMTKTVQYMNRRDVSYKQVAQINVYWEDLYRPELFLRVFTPLTDFDPNKDAVYIFMRTSPPLAAGRKVN